MTRRRVGILGGMFDPIHCGHLDAGAAAQSALDLNEVLILPSNIPPHRLPPMVSSYHRFAMAALAVAGRSGWRVLDLELLEQVTSFTADTLRRLHNSGYSPSELFFIAGADAFVDIPAWKDYPALFELANMAVVSRRGVSVDDMPARLPMLAPRMVRVPPPRAERASASHAEASVGGKADATTTNDAAVVSGFRRTSESTSIFLIDAQTADVSSTAIRQARAAGAPLAGLVPPAVEQHIEQHRLYEHHGAS